MENSASTSEPSDGTRCSADEMDEKRAETMAYEYLCRLEETKKWIESCTGDLLPESIHLEEALRNGVYLAKLGHRFQPELVPLRRIYDADQRRYRASGLTFRHTDNINHWLRAMTKLGLPSIFHPETTDIYEKKNMPRVVYCIHALSLFLYRQGKAPAMLDLLGKAQFSDAAVQAMSLELQRYGFPLPQFGKIGGILASQLPVDEAQHHAAIIAINQATEQSEWSTMLSAMQETAAQLRDIDAGVAHLYLQSLMDALVDKKRTTHERSLNSVDYTADVYDHLLTRREIQEQIDSVNRFSVLEKIVLAVESRDTRRMMAALTHPLLALKRIRPDHSSAYMNHLTTEVASSAGIEECNLQTMMDQVNTERESFGERQLYVQAINRSLEGSDPSRTIQILRQLLDTDPLTDLVVFEFAAALYHEEMNHFRAMTLEDLNEHMILGAIRTLTQVAAVTQAVESLSVSELLFVLEEPLLSFDGVDTSMTQSYLSALQSLRSCKKDAGLFCCVLTHSEIQHCISQVNEKQNSVQEEEEEEEGQEEEEPEDVFRSIQQSVDDDDAARLSTLLIRTGLIGDKDADDNAALYLRLLKTLSQAKQRHIRTTNSEEEEEEEEDGLLSAGDIEEVVEKARQLAAEAADVCLVVASLNNLRDGDVFIQCLDSPHLDIPDLNSAHFQAVTKRLESRLSSFKLDSLAERRAWVHHRLLQGVPVYLNLRSHCIRWQKPPAFDAQAAHLLVGVKEFQQLVADVIDEENDHVYMSRIEPLVMGFQAACRGFLVRERIALRLHHFENNVDAVVKIQTWWRRVIQWQRYRQWQKQREKETGGVDGPDMKYYERHVKDVILVQAHCRRWLAVRAFDAIKTGQLALSTLRRFLHLLDIGQRDYDEEMQVQQLKSVVVQTIRRNKQLEKDLNTMDIKIGLLVKNQIALQEVVAHGHKLRRHVSRRHDASAADPITSSSSAHSSATSAAYPPYSTRLGSEGNARPGIELLSLTKNGRHKLESYQHLFYLLQTEPRYLAKLLFLQPQKLPETMVLSLYNYGSNVREEFLLLKLFRCALEEEVNFKVDSLSDVTTGNTLVIKLIIQLSRQGHRVGQLRDMLGPIVERILKENIFINLSPIEIYKLWINQLESASGQPCGMPYDISAQEALKHPEVQRRLKSSIEFLKSATLLFLNEITSSVRNIPYGMLYVAKVLARALRNKFAHVAEKDILKVIGNLIYYRYINPTIVSPDAFDIICLSPAQVLTTDQRRNLGNIAKMLQFAASKKGFAEESPHLMCLNPFIVECHDRFKRFFRNCIQVEEPDVEFGMDQYSEATLITKPTVCLSLQEVANIHQCLVEYESVLAPHPDDCLHQILDDFGTGDQRNRPSIQYLLAGDTKENVGTFQDLNEVAKTEIFLTLTNKFEVSVSAVEEKNQKLFVATKQMLISILRCCHGDNLKDIIIRPATIDEQAAYTAFCHQQRLAEHNQTWCEQSGNGSGGSRVATQTVSNTDTTEPVLNSLKMRVSRNLRTLEKIALVSSADNYAALVAALARDVVTLRTHRRARSQELERLLSTKRLLDQKTKFHEEQVDSYHQYLETCLKNLTVGKNQKRILQHRSEGNHLQLANALKSRTTLHYSATKLHQKGILMDIEGLPQAHFKSTFFDISPALESGVFDVTAKFMGVSVEKVQLNIQDLLQMQFEGVSVLNIFKKAKINVNLLIFLLNSKFYGMKK